MTRFRSSAPPGLAAAILLALSACADGAGEGNAASGNEAAAAAGEDLLPTPEETEGLADEAAADEAADTNLYGGNAAAGETGTLAGNAAANGL